MACTTQGMLVLESVDALRQPFATSFIRLRPTLPELSELNGAVGLIGRGEAFGLLLHLGHLSVNRKLFACNFRRRAKLILTRGIHACGVDDD
jgi:hypothetical protein